MFKIFCKIYSTQSLDGKEPRDAINQVSKFSETHSLYFFTLSAKQAANTIMNYILNSKCHLRCSMTLH